MLLWGLDIRFSVLSYSPNHIDGWVDGEVGSWRFSGIYGDPQVECKAMTWSLLKHLRGSSDTPWLAGGDFNGILYHHENEGGRAKWETELAGFHESVDVCELVDLGFKGPCFT